MSLRSRDPHAGRTPPPPLPAPPPLGSAADACSRPSRASSRPQPRATLRAPVGRPRRRDRFACAASRGFGPQARGAAQPPTRPTAARAGLSPGPNVPPAAPRRPLLSTEAQRTATAAHNNAPAGTCGGKSARDRPRRPLGQWKGEHEAAQPIRGALVEWAGRGRGKAAGKWQSAAGCGDLAGGYAASLSGCRPRSPGGGAASRGRCSEGLTRRGGKFSESRDQGNFVCKNRLEFSEYCL